MKNTVVAALLLAALPAAASAMDKVAVQPDALKWGPAPASMPPGAQIAVLTGDPGKDGPYVVRVRLPFMRGLGPRIHVLLSTKNYAACAPSSLSLASARCTAGRAAIRAA
jgi:hypothetical protein